MTIEIVDFHPVRVAALEHHGPPQSLNASVGRFIEWRKSSKLSPVATSDTYGIPYGDPEQTGPEEWRFDICGSVTAEVPQNPQGVISKTIPGGRCAVVEHLGSTDTIGHTVRRLYAEWLPGSAEELRDFPCFFQYIRRMPTVSEHEQLTKVYLPLK
jgi:AraC family transcriptional regulator